MRRKGLLGFIAVIIVIAVAAFFTFGHKKTEAKKTVTVGVVGQTNQDEKIWNQVKKTAKEKYGVTVKIKNFTDYNQPNKALQNGEIDLNSFQHKAFLNAWNKANKGTLVPIGNTVIAPIRLYSYKYKNINELPKNATIAVPNDASNESRALYVLKNAGLISFKKGTGKLATIADIDKNPKDLKIKELGAEQTARSLNDVDAAVVNNTYAIPAKLGDKQTIYTEPLNKDSEQWINVIVANKKDKDNEAYKAVVKSYQTDAVKKLIHKAYGNSEVTAWNLKLK
ncbi:MetQ/NlpA family ABC transporter substrate-binding protein [Ligilactobacillus salivarius]|jgi:D-methionine transport system substrate-binding protein|uniref:Lipoprotein n=2 Tax=Ligilactobacillus salivarius TaxID=1624 RepID=A0A1V9SGE5_9LACO|nr:MetQ/NlpA family ABC transporter substrate-binding protein [Ligilactobacillus salivarius]ATP37404.1 ABC transporter substrate-binding protein [Ligilactobacillus salivarius]EEJ73242.1 NLPA lipoprotein [Ligilactobacillus salivarius DSM 20555 = ATCC 11741]KRM69657.1 ABC superfamily ATP binding cassette transporter, binding protein [Ligilactobacillus salivarius DSM 20555 = ATCC 11741]MBE7938294.1 MetQ/NlpA family ABC transporter substrate-binding protein [Ligilactobacillus salivarius]MDG9755793